MDINNDYIAIQDQNKQVKLVYTSPKVTFASGEVDLPIKFDTEAGTIYVDLQGVSYPLTIDFVVHKTVKAIAKGKAIKWV